MSKNKTKEVKYTLTVYIPEHIQQESVTKEISEVSAKLNAFGVESHLKYTK